MSLLDAYNLRARQAPGLLVILPLPLAGVAIGLDKQPVVSVLLSLLTACGLPILLTNTVGVRGRRLQDALRQRWGGLPATQGVRHRDGYSTVHQRAAWRARLAVVTGYELPTEAEERNDADSADQRYDVALRNLMDRTSNRDEFPLVFEENCTYGFERNLLAVRPAGLALAIVTAVTLGIVLIVDLVSDTSINLWSCLIAFVLVIVLAVVWWRVPRPDRVRVVAERYADRLLGALTKVGTEST
jgi:hypothetical protein